MIAGLPYDAEVEYLESTGPQQIDTGVIVNDNNFVLTVDMCSTTAGQSVAWATYFGSYSGEPSMSTRLINNRNNANALYCGYRRRSNGQNFVAGNYFVATDRFQYILEYMKLTIVRPGFNDWVMALGQPEGLEDTSTVKLFGANMRCWAFDITHDGEPIISLTPVRFTNELGQPEGAMYDRVSRKLFRNAGTGAFTIGPDVATPVMGLHVFKSPAIAS